MLIVTSIYYTQITAFLFHVQLLYSNHSIKYDIKMHNIYLVLYTITGYLRDVATIW